MPYQSLPREQLEQEVSLDPCEIKKGSGPAKYYKVGAHVIGLIAPITEKFCTRCNRIRMSAQGKLRPCLGLDYQIPLKQTLRAGKNKKEIKRELKKLILKAIQAKPDGHPWDLGKITHSQMSTIGG